MQGESAWSPEAVVCTQAAVPSWALSDAPFVCDTTAASVVLGWPEPNSNGGAVTGYEAGCCMSEPLAGTECTLSSKLMAAVVCYTRLCRSPPQRTPCRLQVEMDDGSGFRYVARSVERQCTIQGLCSGIVYRQAKTSMPWGAPDPPTPG